MIFTYLRYVSSTTTVDPSFSITIVTTSPNDYSSIGSSKRRDGYASNGWPRYIVRLSYKYREDQSVKYGITYLTIANCYTS